MKSFLVLLTTALAAVTFAASPTQPNILLILADDLGYGELSCQGNPQIPTPHIDSIAQNGIRFTNGYVSGPYCSPTRAALMTGRYQQRYGHEFNPGRSEQTMQNFGLSVEEKTLADRLKAAGYTTGIFGKWHLGAQPHFHPQKRGFDQFFGFLGGAHSYLDNNEAKNSIMRGTTPVPTMEHTTEAFARETVAFIEQAERPWFAYLSFNAVHGPLQSTEAYLKRFESISDPKRRTFAAMLTAMDDAVGSVLAKLAALNLEENTLVFFLSDNGGPTSQTTSSNAPLSGFKTQTLEGGVRVAWMMQWKGRLPAGVVDNRPVIQLDILPTALAATGVEVQTEWKIDGVNLLPYLDGRNTALPHEALFWRMGQQMAVRVGDWKLVKSARTLEGIELPGPGTVDGAELYDLKNDIGEKKNLAAEYPDKVKTLAASWEVWNSEMIEAKWIPQRGNRY